jgi:DNA-binding transcriptional ArsR family regulator
MPLFGLIFNHMVKYSNARLDATFGALSDPTRRAILARLSSGEVTVGELAAPFACSLPAISKHLRVLEEAGLVTRKKRGREQHVKLKAKPMQEAAEWISFYRRFWEDQLSALARFVEENPD